MQKDENGVVLFIDPIKIYLFKDEKEVKISFKITDYIVTNRSMSQENFEYILANYNKGDGVQGLEMDDGKIWWYYSEFGPRPKCLPASMVCVNFARFSFRFSLQEMERIAAEYERQKNNVMHWD